MEARSFPYDRGKTGWAAAAAIVLVAAGVVVPHHYHGQEGCGDDFGSRHVLAYE